MKILIGILMLCVIVIAHELGHMLIAKACHIDVKEFWVGFGPQIFGFTYKGTKYCLRIIPLGGACVFENPELEDEAVEEETENKIEEKPEANITDNIDENTGKVPGKKKTFTEAKGYEKILTLIAGPGFNFLLAFLMSIVVMSFTYMPSATITGVNPDSPAQKAGLEVGDTIVKINSSSVRIYPEVSLAVSTGIGKPLDVVYKRDNKKYRTEIIPEMNEEYGYYMIGVSFGSEDDHKTVPSVIGDAYNYVRYMIKMTFESLKMLGNGQASVRDMSGAVGVVSIVGDEYEAAKSVSPLAVLVSMLNIAILISANLGVLNLLPLPALDGGKLIFAIYETVTGKRVNSKVETITDIVGMLFLITLFAMTMLNDVLRIFGV